MSLNKIIFTSHQIAELYPDVLVEVNATHVPVIQAVNFLGRNEKKILILVNTSDAPYLPDAQLSFLTNILTACNLSLADIAIVNWNSSKTNHQFLIDTLEVKTILLFEVTPLEFGLPINFPEFQIQKFDKHTYLYSPSLQVVESDLGLKKQLWASLKKLFDIS